MDGFDHDYAARIVALYMPFVGTCYEFEDGDRLEIIQIKRREDGPWVTYHTHQGPGIPRKLLMRIDEFSRTYGHLFGIEE